MSKGVAFIFGAAVGTFGGIWLSGKAIEHSIESRGVTYALHNRETGKDEKWVVAFGSKNRDSRLGFVYKKEEMESNETEHNETSEDNRQGSTPE